MSWEDFFFVAVEVFLPVATIENKLLRDAALYAIIFL